MAFVDRDTVEAVDMVDIACVVVAGARLVRSVDMAAVDIACVAVVIDLTVVVVATLVDRLAVVA